MSRSQLENLKPLQRRMIARLMWTSFFMFIGTIFVLSDPYDFNAGVPLAAAAFCIWSIFRAASAIWRGCGSPILHTMAVIVSVSVVGTILCLIAGIYDAVRGHSGPDPSLTGVAGFGTLFVLVGLAGAVIYRFSYPMIERYR